MSDAPSTRWERRDRPWRLTLLGVVVAGPGGAVELVGATATVWRLLEHPMTGAELAAACAATGMVDRLEELDPIGRLLRRDLVRQVP